QRQMAADANNLEPQAGMSQVESNHVRLTADRRFVAGTTVGDQLAVLDGKTLDLVARVPVGTDGGIDSPRSVALTHAGTRAYVTLQNTARLAVVDMEALQQFDTRPDTSAAQTIGVNPIDLPDGASAYWIRIDSKDQFAYVSDYRLGAIYVVDIRPTSPG